MNKLLYLLAFLPFTCSAFSVGVVSDEHLGPKRTRKAGDSIVYPSKAIRYFETAVKEMKSKDVDLIISLGDTTQAGGSKYYKQLKRIENKYGIKVLWVKGNHDDKNFRILGPATYTYDMDDTRFIVLDTGLCPKSQRNAGCLDQSQVDYMNLKKVESMNTVILQHVPPLVPDTCELRNEFIAEEGMTVLSGHFHRYMDCGSYRVFPALTEHKGVNYKIVNL